MHQDWSSSPPVLNSFLSMAGNVAAGDGSAKKLPGEYRSLSPGEQPPSAEPWPEGAGSPPVLHCDPLLAAEWRTGACGT